MYGAKLAQLLRALANSIEKLDEAQLNEFIADMRRPRSPSAGIARKKHSKVDPIELEKVLAKLNDLTTREEGTKLLDGLDLNRKELERLARLRDIHVSKDDNVSRIKEKVVEVVIGSRLNSRAIRGQ